MTDLVLSEGGHLKIGKKRMGEKPMQCEKEVLQKGLSGYAAYQKKVKYRLLPFIR